MTYEKDGYKLVDHIDLNDTGVRMHAKEWNDVFTLTEENDYEGLKAHLINGGDIKKLLETLGIETGSCQETQLGKTVRARLQELEFNIYEVPPQFASASWTKEIWAKVVGAYLLEIIIVCEVENEEGVLEDYPDRITYSGGFTVHWATEIEGEEEN